MVATQWDEPTQQLVQGLHEQILRSQSALYGVLDVALHSLLSARLDPDEIDDLAESIHALAEGYDGTDDAEAVPLSEVNAQLMAEAIKKHDTHIQILLSKADLRSKRSG